MSGVKPLITKKSMETVCDLCLQRLSCKSTEKLFKNDEAQKPKFIFEKNFKSHKRLRITTKNGGLIFNTSKSQLGLLIMRLSQEPTNKTHKEAKNSNNFTT